MCAVDVCCFGLLCVVVGWCGLMCAFGWLLLCLYLWLVVRASLLLLLWVGGAVIDAAAVVSVLVIG